MERTSEELTPVPGGEEPALALSASAQQALASVDLADEAAFASDEPTVIPGDEKSVAPVADSAADSVAARATEAPVEAIADTGAVPEAVAAAQASAALEASATSESSAASEPEASATDAAKAPQTTDDSEQAAAAAIVDAMVAAGAAETPSEAPAAEAATGDEDFLNKVVLPKAPEETLAPSRSALLDEDRTIITGMPPVGMPEATAPVPQARPSSWPSETTLPTRFELAPTFGERVLGVAKARVHASVAQLVLLVIGAGALGGVTVQTLGRPKAARTATVVQMPARQPAVAHLPQIAPLPPVVAAHVVPTPAASKPVPAKVVQPKPVQATETKAVEAKAEAKAEAKTAEAKTAEAKTGEAKTTETGTGDAAHSAPLATEKPAPRVRRPQPAHVAAPAPAVTNVAMAKASPPPAKSAAVAPKKAPSGAPATEAKPRSTRPAVQRAAWVDPFGQ